MHSLKRSISTFLVAAMLAVALPLAVSGCAGGIGSVVSAAPSGPNSNTAIALTSVTTTRELLTAAVNADKISAADAENLRTQLNAARAGIDVAQSLYKTDPSGGDARLAISRAAIDAVRAYLIKQGAKPS